MRLDMNQHYIIKNQFSKLSFKDKINKSYFGWCNLLLSIYFDKKFYINLKRDFLYFKNYMNVPELLFYFGIAFLFITNIFLFPIYALLIKIYWKYRYFKTIKNSHLPQTSMLVFNQINSYPSGLKVLKIIQEHTTNETTYYKVLLENKDIQNVKKEDLLFEADLLRKKENLEKELEHINYYLDLFPKKIEKIIDDDKKINEKEI